MDCIKSLDHDKAILLQNEEAIWRLKIRALWISLGDRNTKFFHSYANQRKVHKAIWEVSDANGVRVTSQSEIEGATSNFFGTLFKKQSVSNLEAHLTFFNV